MTIGGSLFTHNVLKNDYCIREAIFSLLEFCDEVVVLDAESDDGTLEFLKELESGHAKLKVFTDAKWACETEGEKGYIRLSRLANQAKDLLTTDWHFMLQADEVVHEASIPAIREAVESDTHDAYVVRRLNFYKDCDHYVRFDSKMRPVGDAIIRLAKIHLNTHGDGESLASGTSCGDLTDKVYIFHYGFVRNREVMLDKVIEMQTWFGIGVDERVLKQKNTTGVFDPDEFIPDSELAELKELGLSHPKEARFWVTHKQNRMIYREMLAVRDENKGYEEEHFMDKYWTHASAGNAPRIARRNPNLVMYFKTLFDITGLRGSILDIGAGGGNAIHDLREEFTDLSVEGCEFSSSGRKLAKEYYDIDLKPCDLREKLLYEDNEFDWGICIGVLSMIPKHLMANALSEIMRILRYSVIINVTTVISASQFDNPYHVTAMSTPEYWSLIHKLGGLDWTSILPPQKRDFGIGVGGEFAGLFSKSPFVLKEVK